MIAVIGFILFILSLLVGIFLKVILKKFFKGKVDENNEDTKSLLEYTIELSDYKQSNQLSYNNINWSKTLTLFVNGEKIEIENPNPNELLAYYVRNTLGLTGTKLGCEEGGCGACSVVLTRPDGIVSVNSCLRPLCCNDGMSITTVEGIGSVKNGLSEEQKRLVANNGTQCGYCTPGWIANMHSLRESASLNGVDLSKREIEEYFDGNICRCTGYKPIIEAFGTFAHENKSSNDCCEFKIKSDKPDCIGQCITPSGEKCNHYDECCSNDIEDGCSSSKSKSLKIGSGIKSKPLGRAKDLQLVRNHVIKPLMFYNSTTNKRWIRPTTIEQLQAVLKHFSNTSIQLVGGNTSIGVSKYFNSSKPYYIADQFDVYVDINAISSFNSFKYNEKTKELVVGSTYTINSTVELLKTYASHSSSDINIDYNNVVDHTSIFSIVANHLSMIANNQVRNAASWAGNLMLFLRYKSFPSDAVLALTTANVKLHICNKYGDFSYVYMSDFLTLDYDEFISSGSFIIALSIFESSNVNSNIETIGETFKVAQRDHNAHAYVNGGFLFTISNKNSSTSSPPFCHSARIVIGGVSKQTFIPIKTQKVLSHNNLTTNILHLAMQTLKNELNDIGLNENIDNAKFSIDSMEIFLYRAVLRCYPIQSLPSHTVSAVLPWVKPLSSGTEVFLPSDSSQGAVGKPVHKLEGAIQSTGEAVYPSDEPMSTQGLFGVMIYSTKCGVNLVDIDTSNAANITGVVSILTATDIPGENTIGKDLYLFVPIGEQVKSIGQPLGVVLASTEAIAIQAVSFVTVSYSEQVTTLVTNINDAISSNSFYKIPDHIPSLTMMRQGNAEKALINAKYRSKGHISAGGQSHFYMETQCAVASVNDSKYIDIVCGTQDPSGYQSAVATVLGVPVSDVTVKCTRAGGGFGGKITRGIAVAATAALGASILGRPIRIFNSRTADMVMTGGRESFAFDYEVGYNEAGQIVALKYEVYVDAGVAVADAIGGVYMGMNWADNAYYFPNYLATAKICYTNTNPRTSMRAPGVVQTCLATEMVIERVAVELNLPMTTVQQVNFIQNGESTIGSQIVTDSTLQTVWDKALKKTDFFNRYNNIVSYNQSNLWNKKGLAICPVKYGIGWGGYNAGIRLGVRSTDGTVIVSHNGCEIGQGINTKVAQVVSKELNIPLTLIRVTSTATDKVVNGGVTGGSGTSEVVSQAAINACATLNQRLAPYITESKAETSDDRTTEWLSLLSSLPSTVSLNVEGWYSPSGNPNGQPFQYFVYAACVTEVSLDVLSGKVHVLSSDITYDCGQSLNPAVDIGQIEGGFVMGLGYFLTEAVNYDSSNGYLKSVGTWEYKPPLSSDIPSKFSITFLKNAYNNSGILGSKAVGEPPCIISNSIYFALKMAIKSARSDAGINKYFELDVPSTIDIRQQASLVTRNRLVLPF